MLEITRHDRGDADWETFVARHPLATAAHLPAWGDIVREAYGHEPLALVARAYGAVVGVLPLVFLKSRLFGHRLVSMPFLDYGGILAEPGSREEQALADAALAAGRECRAQTIGLRQRHPSGLPQAPTGDRVTMLLPIGDEDRVWRALPSERRNRIRKGAKNGLHPQWGGAELLDDFYRVFTVNMRDLGSPVHSRRFFAAILGGLGDGARVLLVRDRDERVIGGGVCLFFRDTILVPWVSSLREAFALCPNFTLYWEVIRFGCGKGYRVVDLGRSHRGAGTFEFKRQWGATPQPLPWLFMDVTPGAAPPVDRDVGRLSLLVGAWKHLPLAVANLAGPWVRGQVPN